MALVLVLFVAAQPLSAQKWKEKLNATKEKVNNSLNETSGNKDYSEEFEGKEFPDMMTYLDGWNNKTVKTYNWSSRDNRYYVKEAQTIVVGKNGDEYEYVMVNGKKYVPIKNADSDKILKFQWSSIILYFSEDKLVTYGQNEEGDVFIKQLFGLKENAQKVTAEIEAYLAYTASLIDQDVAGANAERERIAAEKAAARKAKYGLHDKSIKSAKVLVNLPQENGNFMNVSFIIETTLTDGSIIKTRPDEGFYEDYIITKNFTTDFSGNIESGFIDGDQAVVKVVSKYDSKITAEGSATLSYNKGPVFLLYGRGWSGSEGEDGEDVEIEIIEDKHAVTGEPVLRVRLTSTAERAKLKEFSLSPNQSFIVKTYGGKGGEDNSRFYNGGDGGDIIVYKDPSVSSFRIKYDTKGGAPGGSSASFGRDGDYRVIEQALNFNH